MTSRQTGFWIQKADMGRLFGAENVCYCLNESNHARDIGDVHGAISGIGRSLEREDRMLLVTVVDLRHLKAKQGETGSHSSVVGGGCILCIGWPGGAEDESGFACQDGFVELRYPPPAHSQILVYGGEFQDERQGSQKLEAFEALDDWLSGGEQNPPQAPPLFVADLRVTPEFVSGPQWGRFARLLERAGAIGVGDEATSRIIAGRLDSHAHPNLFLMGNGADSWGIADGDISGSKSLASVSRWLLLGYIANLESKHNRTAGKLLEILEQLADVQFERDRLLASSSALSAEIEGLRKSSQQLREQLRELERQVEKLREKESFQIAEGIHDTLARNRLTYHFGKLVARYVRRIVKK